ncbi:MAG: hypothetical protein AABY81_06485 [Pseudomonadota bacterium]
MRPSRILVVLMLLVAPHGVCAQQQAQPLSLTKQCYVPVDPRWTPQEKFVWKRVCIGNAANFNKEKGYGGQLDPKKPDGWPQNRVLRSAFLETILLTDPYRRALTRRGVVIIGARFTEAIDLEGAELQHRLGLTNSLIENDVDLRRLRSKYPIALEGSKVAGTLKANGLDLGANLLMRYGEFATMDFVTAHVGGQLILKGSKVTGKLNMSGLRVDDVLHIDEAELAEVDLIGVHVGEELALSRSKVTGKLSMVGLRVDNNLYMNKAEFAEVDLVSAYVSKELTLSGSKVTGKLNMNGLRVGTILNMNIAEFAEVELTGAVVRYLVLSGSKVTGELICYDMEVGQQVFMDDAVFGGPIDLRVAKIKGDLHLMGKFSENVDLTGAEIDGSLNLSSAQWSPDVTLSLRNAKIGLIPDLADDWAPKLDFDGLTYLDVGKADQFEHWFLKLDSYTPQPYDQLASVVEAQGESTLATAIRYSGRERERSQATSARRVGLTILKWVIGYGYYPERSVLWVFGLVVMGAVVLRVSGEGSRNGMPFGLAYSFDMLLPVIRLREKHYKIDLQTWARYYFYGQKIMGYVLAFFLVAALSGLAK